MAQVLQLPVPMQKATPRKGALNALRVSSERLCAGLDNIAAFYDLGEPLERLRVHSMDMRDSVRRRGEKMDSREVDRRLKIVTGILDVLLDEHPEYFVLPMMKLHGSKAPPLMAEQAAQMKRGALKAGE